MKIIKLNDGSTMTIAAGNIDEIAKQVGGTVVESSSIAPEGKTIQEQIDELENSVTKRNYRGAIAGIQYDVDVINNINAEIAVLALEL